MHEDSITLSGRSLGEELAEFRGDADGCVIHPAASRLTRTGGMLGLRGNLASEGAILKVASIIAAEQVFTGPARVSECEVDAYSALRQRSDAMDDVIVIRNEGPQADRVCAKCWRQRRRSMGKAWAKRQR